MIIEIPDENSIVKWKNNEKDEWKVAEISDLIKAYERPQGEWIENLDKLGLSYICPFCGHEMTGILRDLNYCCKCGAAMRGKQNDR